MQAGVGKTPSMVMFWHRVSHRPQESHMLQPHTVVPLRAHRAPDPVPGEEPLPDPFEPAEPHHAPIRTPQNDEPPTDPNPSVFALGQQAAVRLH
jgi:hypothetical protein